MLCRKCGRERPSYIADPSCGEGGYCDWIEGARVEDYRLAPSGRALIHALHGIDEENDQPCSPPCDEEYCGGCAMAECPHAEPLHRHHDGCPACYVEEMGRSEKGEENEYALVAIGKDGSVLLAVEMNGSIAFRFSGCPDDALEWIRVITKAREDALASTEKETPQ